MFSFASDFEFVQGNIGIACNDMTDFSYSLTKTTTKLNIVSTQKDNEYI